MATFGLATLRLSHKVHHEALPQSDAETSAAAALDQSVDAAAAAPDDTRKPARARSEESETAELGEASSSERPKLRRRHTTWRWSKGGPEVPKLSARCCCRSGICICLTLCVSFSLMVVYFVIAYSIADYPEDMEWEDGPYATAQSRIEVGGFEPRTKDWLSLQTALAYVPTGGNVGNRTFPLLSFSHGDGSGWPWTNFWYGDLPRKVSSHGFVILAHESCVPTCDNEQYLDQLHVLTWADDKRYDGTASADPVLRLVDFSKPKGVFGQSTGGRASIQSAAEASTIGTQAQQACVGAAVLLNSDPCVGETGRPGWRHGDCDAARFVTNVGMAVFTGTEDRPEPKGSSEAILEAAPTTDKIYANMTGAGHMDGCSALWAGFAAAFFQVHLNAQGPGTPYFERVYSNSSDEALCGGHYPMAHCVAPEPSVWQTPAQCAAELAAATTRRGGA